MIVRITSERPVPIEQSGPVVRFDRRRPEDGDISALSHVNDVYNHIRMLDGEGYPRAFARVGRFRLEFDRAALEDGVVEARVKIVDTANE